MQFFRQSTKYKESLDKNSNYGKIYYINVSWKELYGDDVDKVMDECGECDEEEISTLEDDAWRMYVGFKDNILPSGSKAVEMSEVDLSKDGLYISSS